MTNTNSEDILVAGSFRSGQTWLCIMLASLRKSRFIEPYCLIRNIPTSSDPYVIRLTESRSNFMSIVIKTHSRPDPLSKPNNKTILTYRDPHKAIASEISRRKTILFRGTGSDELNQINASSNPPSRHINLYKYSWLILSFLQIDALYLAYKWRCFYASWIADTSVVCLVNYDRLVHSTSQTLHLIGERIKGDRYHIDDINQTITNFSRTAMLDRARSLHLPSITVTSTSYPRLNPFISYLLRRITGSVFKELLKDSKNV